MARTGNHGLQFPRDRALLSRLYWDENRSLPEIGALFGVNHKSVLSVFRKLDIPRRSVGVSRVRGCIVCGAPVFKIKHAGNGTKYGRRCKLHWNEHRCSLSKSEAATEIGAARKKKLFRRWYLGGPVNPKGDKQWISKSRAMLRSVRRLLARPAVLQSLNAESELEQILQAACPASWAISSLAE